MSFTYLVVLIKQAVGGRPPRYAPAPVRAVRCGSAPAHTRPACCAQRALLPVVVGAMNIHDVRDRRQIDVRGQTASLLNAPGARHNNNRRRLQLMLQDVRQMHAT